MAWQALHVQRSIVPATIRKPFAADTAASTDANTRRLWSGQFAETNRVASLIRFESPLRLNQITRQSGRTEHAARPSVSFYPRQETHVDVMQP